MNAFVAALAAQHQPIVKSEKKNMESKHSHISLQSFDLLTYLL